MCVRGMFLFLHDYAVWDEFLSETIAYRVESSARFILFKWSLKFHSKKKEFRILFIPGSGFFAGLIAADYPDSPEVRLYGWAL